MKAKNLMVFFLTLATVLLVVGSIAAAVVKVQTEPKTESLNQTGLVMIESVEVNDLYVTEGDIAVEAGSVATIKVTFIASKSASDVKLGLYLAGDKIDTETISDQFTIEQGKKYSKTLSLEIPNELKDEVSKDANLKIKVWNKDYKTEDDSTTLRIQRPSYDASFMSIDSAQSVDAGKTLSVSVTLKNTGYNDLDDVYVTLKIAELDIERTSYFGDLSAVETEDNEDIMTKTFYLEMPSDAEAGTYSLELEAHNDDLSATDKTEIVVNSEVSGNALVASSQKSTTIGGEAEFEIILVNPTENLRVYKIVLESDENLETSSSEQLVAVSAGMSKKIIVTAKPQQEGEHNFKMHVFSGDKLIDSVELSVKANGKVAPKGSIMTLSVILAVIFVVLLGTLFALLRNKPKQSEEVFGESYY